ncbi:DUF6242 domain-containing protein [Parabacteroides sp. OttesenSCG-928-N08]|nr:DUF6242 domain-containing protein [Parabacteroides sp. OttesenSCG-928-N08]
MKNRVGLFIVGCFLLVMSSCWDDQTTSSSDVYKNCQIRTFILQHDSIDALSTTKFTIDQVNGLIFNADSLPYGTELDKVICKITYIDASVVTTNRVIQTASNDTTWWNSSDSIDFSKPVSFEVGAFDGVTTKKYTAWVNIHQIHPDSMKWSQFAQLLPGVRIKKQKVITQTYNEVESFFLYIQTSGNNYKLYRSSVTDAVNWEELPLSGLPIADMPLEQITLYNNVYYLPSMSGELYGSEDGISWQQIEQSPAVKTLLGVIPAGNRQPSAMCTIVEEEGLLRFASFNEEQEWSAGEEVPSLFPVSGFCNHSYNSMYYDYLMVVAGRDRKGELLNTSWSTMDGKSWALLSDLDSDYFDAREGAMLTLYDDQLLLLGGIGTGGKGFSDMKSSIDHGVTWAEADSLWNFPTTFTGRGFSSVYVDEAKYLYLFGGETRSNTDDLNEIWRGRINRLGFKK